MATPSIPPRPSRSLHPASASNDTPTIPPRPTNRRIERSVSPSRFAPSPLNENPNVPSHGHGLTRMTSRDLPPRPPSVTLPSIGQEGSEYADIDYTSDASSIQTPAETRNVGGDLKLHAPKPSLAKSTASARIQTVTRTDSSQAAAAGIGSAVEDSDSTETPPLSKSRTSFSRPGSSGSGRRSSVHFDDHGIPAIGQRVPMNPNAGDIQAPATPGQPDYVNTPPNGKNRSGRHHKRTKSGRDLPPGSYGLHGHGVHTRDKFEKAWEAKHPEAAAREEGHYGPGSKANRTEWALSSDDLNKLVHSNHPTAAIPSVPDEQIGYLASEEYASRFASPAPGNNHRSSMSSQTKVESPLRQSFSIEDSSRDYIRKNRRARSDVAAESEDEDVIHVDEPSRPTSKYGGGGYDPPTEDLGPQGGNTSERGGWIIEHGYDTPILASDEIAKEIGGEFMHPAVSPRRQSFDTSRPTSAAGSRPVSMHLPSLSRFQSRDERELEMVQEYEPLFPEEEEEESQEKPISAAERFKQRPDMKRRFPSQDIWEDSPGSAHLSATVNTPEVQSDDDKSSTTTFEHPDQEAARKEEVPESEKEKLIPREERLAKSQFRPDLRDDMPTRDRPGVQRFPSRDIWEDTPESAQLVTTVGGSESEESSPVEAPAKPQIPPRPARRPHNITPVGASPLAQEAHATSPTETRQAPSIPDRPKPQIPARPAKAGETSPEAPKAKPAAPPRPAGSKIAALKAGFMSDLNKTLSLGPQAPKKAEKEEEPAEEEKAPLSDARKGRARGPQRRKPAAPAAEEPKEAPKAAVPTFSFSMAQTIFSDGHDGRVVVPGHASKSEPKSESEAVESEHEPVHEETVEEKAATQPEAQAPSLARNTAGETADPDSTSQISEPASKADIGPPMEAEEQVKAAHATTETSSPLLQKSEQAGLSDESLDSMTAEADGKKVSDGAVEETTA